MPQIRNLAVVGHGGEGKSSLCESLLALTKTIERQNKTSASDFDPEEQKRGFSLSTSVLPLNHKDTKLNLLDTPGTFDFEGEVRSALRVAEAALIVCDAKQGTSVGAEKAWKLAEGKARMIYISKIDEDNANFETAFNNLREKFGASLCPVIVPLGDGDHLKSVVNLVSGTVYEGDQTYPLPDHHRPQLDDYHTVLDEHIAETSEKLMEEFFSDQAFTPEEIRQGLIDGIHDGSICPVFCGSALTGVGAMPLLDALTVCVPPPSDTETDTDGETLQVSATDPTSLFVFKTFSDQYGKLSFFKVVSGALSADTVLKNQQTGAQEKCTHLLSICGKKHTEVHEIAFGDIGAVQKLQNTHTGDTLSADVFTLAGIPLPTPSYSLSFVPKVKGGEEKIVQGLHRLGEEDLSFSVEQNAETHQLIVSGQGDMHLDVLISRLKNRFGAEAATEDVKIPYRETIRKKVLAEGKHKKQSGGHGQYGHVRIEFEPQSETDDLVFAETIFGGSVPKNFHPAVEKGLRDHLPHGVLAGYPVVGLKATLTDGSYHDVDSSEMAFKLAAGIAFKEGLPKASPALLEPIGNLQVTVPEAFTGDIIGDLNKRRGHILGMNSSEDGEIIEADVPIAEMSRYAIDLRSMTHGYGVFALNFDRYQEVPANLQDKIIAETAKS